MPSVFAGRLCRLNPLHFPTAPNCRANGECRQKHEIARSKAVGEHHAGHTTPRQTSPTTMKVAPLSAIAGLVRTIRRRAGLRCAVRRRLCPTAAAHVKGVPARGRGVVSARRRTRVGSGTVPGSGTPSTRGRGCAWAALRAISGRVSARWVPVGRGLCVRRRLWSRLRHRPHRDSDGNRSGDRRGSRARESTSHGHLSAVSPARYRQWQHNKKDEPAGCAPNDDPDH